MVQRLILKEIYEATIDSKTLAWNKLKYINNLDNALRYVERYNSALNKKGIKVNNKPQKIGSGALGTAFKLSDGTVLKITEDRTEARAAKNIEGKNFKNVYHIYGVYEFGTDKVYAIWQEWLDARPIEPLKRDEIFSMAFYFIINRNTLGMDGASDEEIKEEIDIFQKNKEALTQKQSTLLFNVLHDISSGLRELQSSGVSFRDYHLNNLLYRRSNDQYVIIDLGISRSPAAKVDTLSTDEPEKEPSSAPKIYKMPGSETI